MLRELTTAPSTKELNLPFLNLQPFLSPSDKTHKRIRISQFVKPRWYSKQDVHDLYYILYVVGMVHET